MAGRRQSSALQARERARAARAVLDAERLERERRVEEQATSYFVALEAHEEAVQRAGEAEVQMARSVQALLELGETVERVAVQCELSEQEVRRLRKLATTGDGRQDEEDAPEASTVDVDEVKAAKPAAARVSVAAGEDSTALAVDVTRGEPALVS